jgi:hypothetical protein
MQTNLALHAPLFGGAVLMNGVPVINEGSMRLIQTKGGIISLNNVVTGATPYFAYFGSVMTVNPAGDQAAFYVGNPTTTYSVIGILLNEQGVRMNDPAKPTYIMNEMPATVVVGGRVWINSWDTTFAGALAVPVVGCRVIYRMASASTVLVGGMIGFLAAAGAIPGTHAQLNAAVVGVNGITGSCDLDLHSPAAT